MDHNGIFRLILFFFSLFIISCSIQHEFDDLNIRIDLGDECLTCFPECSTVEDFRCVSANGVLCNACMVSCVAAVTLACDERGPVCHNLLGNENFLVPVVCVEKVPTQTRRDSGVGEEVIIGAN